MKRNALTLALQIVKKQNNNERYN